SGSNLFGTVGDATNSVVVVAEHPKMKAAGTLDPAGQVIKSSQGGTGATIGVDSQMFDPGEGAFFTYVRGSTFLGPADDSALIAYPNGTLAATSASVTISQTQGNALASMSIAAFDVADSPQQRPFVDGIINGGTAGIGTPVTITSVRVFNAAGVKIED